MWWPAFANVISFCCALANSASCWDFTMLCGLAKFCFHLTYHVCCWMGEYSLFAANTYPVGGILLYNPSGGMFRHPSLLVTFTLFANWRRGSSPIRHAGLVPMSTSPLGGALAVVCWIFAVLVNFPPEARGSSFYEKKICWSLVHQMVGFPHALQLY